MIGVELVEDKVSPDKSKINSSVDVNFNDFVFNKITNDQKTRTPLKLERMAAIFEQTKDMGVLFGKGGLYGNVSNLFYH